MILAVPARFRWDVGAVVDLRGLVQIVRRGEGVRIRAGVAPETIRAHQMRRPLRLVIADGQRGEYCGPVRVLAEVTREDYCAWLEEDTGVVPDRRLRMNLYNQRFYRIVID